jgi:hypothetical protein
VDPCYLFKKCGIPMLKSGAFKTEPVYNPGYFSGVTVAAQ